MIFFDMILNSYLKKNNIQLDTKHRSHLGINLFSCFKEKYPKTELKKVQINQNGKAILVYDYPRDFFEQEYTKKVFKRFLNKMKNGSKNY